MSNTPNVKAAPAIDQLFEVGLHYGFSRSRRHPSARPFLFGQKDGGDIFDLELTRAALDKASAFVAEVAAAGKQVMFVSGKTEIGRLVREAAEACEMPFVVGRWIGGTLTNFEQVQQRVSRLIQLREEREKGELAKYTKRERLMIDREIESLEERFGGIVTMRSRPGAVVVIDPKREHIAVAEANATKVPVVALANADCDMTLISHPVPGNDASVASAELVLRHLSEAAAAGRAAFKAAKPEAPATPVTPIQA
jgi:small subunit ribosomal protein S2